MVNNTRETVSWYKDIDFCRWINEKVKEIGREIKKASLYTPFRSLCFEQALTVKLMLKKRKIPATIYLGVAKEEDTKLHAHAWTRAGNYIVSGKREKDLFKVVSSFS